MRQSLRHLGNIPCPRCQECRTFVDLIGNDLVEGVGLAVMGFTILRRQLQAEVCRHALIQERDVIRRAEVACRQRLKIKDFLPAAGKFRASTQ